MRDDKEQVPSFDAATPQPGWNDFDDQSGTKDCSVGDENGSPQEKKPYKKPTYRYEQVFETMALSCGKISGTQFECRFHRHNS